MNFMTRLLSKVKYKLVSYARITLVKSVGLVRSYSLEKSMMIFGEPRSGSTWLMELLANYERCIVVWEPTHPFFGVNPVQFRGEPRIFEDPSNTNALLANYMADVLTLKKVNKWTLNYTTFKSIVYSNNTLTKFVHGTLLLPWIINNMRLDYKPIYIVRHPIAIALSQIKGNMNIEKEMMSETTFQRVYPDQYDEYRRYMVQLDSPLEKLVAMWCLHHKYLLPHINSEKLILIYYEELLTDPFEGLRKIGNEWNIDLEIEPKIVRRPSKTDFGKHLKQDPVEQLSKWQTQVSVADKNKIQKILDYFRINFYSVRSPLPVKS